MTITNFQDGVSSFGMTLGAFPTGNVYYVANDSDTASSLLLKARYENIQYDDGTVAYHTTVQSAINATTTNRNDTILLDGIGSHSFSTGITLTKSRIHFIGMDGGNRILQQGTKLSLATASSSAFVLKNTGTRNTFENIKFINSATAGTALHVVEMGGEGSVYKNCSFVFGVADNLDQTNAYEVVMGEDSGTFINCMFGSDTLKTTVARAVMAIDQVTASQEMKSNVFKDCMWNINSSDANAHFIRVLANTDMKFHQIFIDPVFHATIVNSQSTAVLTEAVENEVQAVEGNMLFIRPATNTTQFSTATNANTNIKVVAAVSAANVIEGIAPIA